MYLCISLHTTIVPNTAQQSSDNLSPFPPDSYHYLDVVYWRKGHGYPKNLGTNTVSVHPKMLFDTCSKNVTSNDISQYDCAEFNHFNTKYTVI